MRELVSKFFKLMPDIFTDDNEKGKKLKALIEKEKSVKQPTVYLVDYLFVVNEICEIYHGAEVFFNYDVAVAYCEYLASDCEYLKNAEFKYKFDTGKEEEIYLNYDDEQGNKEHICLSII